MNDPGDRNGWRTIRHFVYPTGSADSVRPDANVDKQNAGWRASFRLNGWQILLEVSAESAREDLGRADN
jgi:hypothetical protein